MAYSKRESLTANIEAIEIAFRLKTNNRQATDSEWETLKKYSGFGGLKCVLNPIDSDNYLNYWSKSEAPLIPLVRKLHEVIRDNTASEQEYKRYIESLTSSVLTAFYTPLDIPKVIAVALSENNILLHRILDPSAGVGAFSRTFNMKSTQEMVNFEKDLLSGLILNHVNVGHTSHVRGFETMETEYNDYFDIVTSNIPFGDISIFDPTFTDSGDTTRKKAANTIHNYFFLKGIDTLREGGLLAFITSQGVLNAPPMSRYGGG